MTLADKVTINEEAKDNYSNNAFQRELFSNLTAFPLRDGASSYQNERAGQTLPNLTIAGLEANTPSYIHGKPKEISGAVSELPIASARPVEKSQPKPIELEPKLPNDSKKGVNLIFDNDKQWYLRD